MHRFLTVVLFVLSFAFLQAQDSFEIALQNHVKELSSEKYKGRPAGSPSEAKVAARVSACFKENGLELLYPGGFQDFSYVDEATGDTLYSQNVVAVIPGYDPALRDEYIVIGAHYDTWVPTPTCKRERQYVCISGCRRQCIRSCGFDRIVRSCSETAFYV